MKLEGENLVAAPKQVVWDALNDETLLIECIPGCNALERISDDELAASVTAKVGPVKVTFKGEVRLENVSPPHSYTLVGQGKGAAGFARGRADVALHDNGDGATQLAWSVEAKLGGKLQQMGARLIDSTAKKYAEDFFSRFSGLVKDRADTMLADAEATHIAASEPAKDTKAPAATTDTLQAGEEPTEGRKALPPAIWVPLVILVVAGLLVTFGI